MTSTPAISWWTAIKERKCLMFIINIFSQHSSYILRLKPVEDPEHLKFVPVTASKYIMMCCLRSTVGWFSIGTMCRESFSPTSFLCGHPEDGPTQITQLDGCGGCGIVKTTTPVQLGKTTRRHPCDDCVAQKTWVKTNNVWSLAVEDWGTHENL